MGVSGYVFGKSLLHRVNPVAKFACAVLVALASFCTSNLVFLGALLVFGIALSALCGMARKACGLVAAVCAFSLVLAAVQVLTTPVGAVLIPLPWGYIGAGSLLAAVTTLVRLSAAALPLFLVFSTTRTGDLANASVKVLRVPYRYAFAFSSSVNFIPAFLGDMRSVMEAQTARGVEFDGGLAKKVRLMVPLCRPLLVSSVRRAGNIAAAAEVRGFDLRTSASGFKEYPIATRDVLALAACALALAASATLGVLGA